MLIHEEKTYQIIGACFEVHKHLGNGFLEAVYAEALALELQTREIPFERDKILEISYKEFILEKKYIADLICYKEIIIELKAVAALTPQNEAQIINYLNATGLRVGLLVNFGEKSLKYKRFVL